MDPATLHQSLDYLADQITQLEGRMSDQINPREFGQLEGAVKALTSKMGDLATDVEELSKKVDNLTTLITEAKGGWRALMWVAGASATAGGAVVAIVKMFLPVAR